MDRRLTKLLIAFPVLIGLGVSSPTSASPWSRLRSLFSAPDAPARKGEEPSGRLAESGKRTPRGRPLPTKTTSRAENSKGEATSPIARTAASKSPVSKRTIEKIHWQTDLREARALSVRENRPLLIMFSADWCTFCHKLERQTLSEPDLVEYINARFIPVKLDVEEHQRIASVLEVDSLPASVVLSPKADLLGTITGYFDKSEYQSSLRDALALEKTLQQASMTTSP